MPEPSTSTARSHALVWIFKGRNGVRAGWSIGIFAAILGSLFFGLRIAAVRLLHMHEVPGGELSPAFVISWEILSVAATLIATAVMARLEGRSPWSYGLAGERPVRYFGAGWLGGLLCLSALVAALRLSGHLAFDGFNAHGSAAVAYGLIWFLGFTLTGINEEAMCRGYVQSTLARGMGFWGGAVVSSLLFSLAHLINQGESIFGIASAFTAGMLLCLLLRMSGSLWLGIGFHGAWDWAQSYLYGTPDSAKLFEGHLLASHALGDERLSGGAAGPEGSLLQLPALLFGLLLLVWVWRRLGLFGRPSQ